MRARDCRAMLLGAALLGAACGQPVDGRADAAVVLPGDAGPAVIDAGVPDAGAPAHFEADPLPSGAAIWLKVDLTAAQAPQLEVWARGVGPVLGLAFHLGVDPAQLKIETAGAEPVMGSPARYLQRIRGGDVAFGLVRLGTTSGEADLTAPTRIAVLGLSAAAAVDSKLTIDRVLARRADGTQVPLSVAAGRLVLPGGVR